MWLRCHNTQVTDNHIHGYVDCLLLLLPLLLPPLLLLLLLLLLLPPLLLLLPQLQRCKAGWQHKKS
jgi:hypothetical protein